MNRTVSMFDSKRAVLWGDVQREVLDEWLRQFPLPDQPIYVIGPRGGRYRAVEPWTRTIVDNEDRWDKTMVTVIDRSAGLKYVRPAHSPTA